MRCDGMGSLGPRHEHSEVAFTWLAFNFHFLFLRLQSLRPTLGGAHPLCVLLILECHAVDTIHHHQQHNNPVSERGCEGGSCGSGTSRRIFR